MRLEVSWMVSRMVFMPSMVRGRTASPPLCATLDRMTRHIGGELGVAGHLLHGARHAGRGLGGRGDLLGLRTARPGEVLRQRLRLARRALQLDCRAVDGGHEAGRSAQPRS